MDQQNNAPKKRSGNEVREGQENSSILHDKKDPKKELRHVTQNDIGSASKEEFIDDDENTKKQDQ
jgi:hypothetical protein